jgi:penicillin-binding protein 1A
MSYLRVFYGVATGQKQRGGGSTLSQQLAKNLYPRKDFLSIKTENKTHKIPIISNAISLLINKIRENFISVRLEKVYNKQQLLNLYLNTVPFGENAFGINVASRQQKTKQPHG